MEHRKSRTNEAFQSSSKEKKPFEEPKLTYVRPKLSKHGKAVQVTQTYFGSFSA